MSKLADAAATAHTLSIAAMEEASRSGRRTADLDHLFLALVVNEQPAGRALRGLGITLDAARDAVAAQHAEQLASLGITMEPPAPGRITFHETGGYTWGERALDVIQAAGSGGKRGDAAAVLRELVVEPSGLIAAVLHRLATTPESVVSYLDELERVADVAEHPVEEPGTLAGVFEGFAPAPVEQVWALLADPARMPEWEPSIGSVDAAPDIARIGDVWTAWTRRQRPDGAAIQVKPALRRQRLELIARDEGRCIGWLFTCPDAADVNDKRLEIELAPAPGGTRVHVSLAWVRPTDRRRSLLGWFLRPLVRHSVRMQVARLGGGISRVFR